jgi:pimeloyl-ACP methyl ester carboxylesterase
MNSRIFIFDFYYDTGTPTAAMNYYRSIFRHRRDDLQKRVTVPVLMIWGCQDAALGEELADASQNYCSNIRLEKIQNASHWVQQDAPEETNQYMDAFLNEKSAMK